MHFVNAKTILSAQNGMNLYRGCTHGCIYCDSRSTCYNFDHAFEDIAVKRNAPALLEQALRSKRRKCMIGRERFKALEIFRDHGIPTVVWLSPILPYLNDTIENIDGILDYCIRAGVKGIICFGMGD